MQDNRQRIIELAEECSLFQDVDKCTNARATLTHPRNRLSAEIAWMPGTDSQHVNQLLKLLESPTRNFLNLTGLTPLAQTNLFVSGLLHLANPSKSNTIEWMLKISRTFEYIDPAEVHAILNEERRKVGFSEIPDVSAVTEGIQNRRQYYRQTIKLVLEKLSAEERAEAVTVVVESTTHNSESRLPVLIEDLVALYETSIQSYLEKEKRIVEALDEKIRVVADVEGSETILTSTINQLIDAVKKWDTLAQPIQVIKNKRGEHHDPSFDVAWRVRDLAIHLCNEYDKPDFALQLTIMLQEVFVEVPQIAERLLVDIEALNKMAKERALQTEIIGEFENIKAQVEKIRTAIDTKSPDTTLTPLVNQLVHLVKKWDASALPIEVNYGLSGTVRDLALHLWNEHNKLEFSRQVTSVLVEVFLTIPEIVEHLREDLVTLNKIAAERARLMEEAKRREEKWRREITYEVEIGILFKNKLRISPEGIEWQGDRWNFDSINCLRWGGTRHSINGIPTGTTYTIVFGNDFNYASIESRNKTIYNNVIERLWRAVGVRLLTEYLEGWREGKTYKFDSAVISDHGVELERKRFFSSNERVFCQWSELVIWNDPGTFCIGKNNERKLSVSLSYQYEDNIHVIEAAIRMLLERGIDRLSQLLVE